MTTPQQLYYEMKTAGLTLRQAVAFTDQMLQAKQALFQDIVNGLKGMAELSGPALHAALIAPPAVGYLLGGLGARALDADGSNVADIQEQELVAELAAQAESLRRRQKLRQDVVKL